MYMYIIWQACRLQELDNPELGINYLEIALDMLISVDSTYTSLLYSELGRARTKNYQYKQAIKDFETALIYNPADYSVLHEIALVYDYNLKNRKKSIEYYKRYVKCMQDKTLSENEEHPFDGYFKEYIEARIQRLEEDEFMEGGKKK